MNWHALWVAGQWDLLVPAIRAHVARVVPAPYRYNTDDVEDVASEVCLRCWLLETVPDVPQAFVTRMAKNYVYDIRKSYGHRNRCGLEHALDEQSRQPSPLQVVEHRDTLERTLRHARELPAAMRDAVLLGAWLGNHEETANALGTNVGVIKMRVHRARQALHALQGAA